VRTIAVIGDDANDNPVYRGEGSGEVVAEYVVTPLQVWTDSLGHPHSRSGTDFQVVWMVVVVA
jgi:hypothetical protein